MNMLFMEPGDVHNTWGNLVFRAHPLNYYQKINVPSEFAPAFFPDPNIAMHPSWTDEWLNQSGIRISIATRTQNAGYEMFGVKSILKAEDVIAKPNEYYRMHKIYRISSKDGFGIDDLQLVFEAPADAPLPSGRWTTGYWMTKNPDTSQVFFFPMGYDEKNWIKDQKLGVFVFSSNNGDDWSLLSSTPAYWTMHDNVSVMWDRRQKCYFAYQIIQKPVDAKPLPDNVQGRRVVTVLKSKDFLDWEKVNQIEPDVADAPDIEFYRLTTFPYGDRYVGMANLYAPSPLRPYVHGPHLMCEWWISDDAVNWKRPWRQIEAQGAAPYTIESHPIEIGDDMLWWINDKIWGVPKDRLFSIYSKSNAVFETKPFIMPDSPLFLNASVRKQPRWLDQSYVMAELMDEYGNVIPGYEREKSTIRETDNVRIPLVWDKETGHALLGREVSLRLYLRDADIYELFSDEDSSHAIGR